MLDSSKKEFLRLLSLPKRKTTVSLLISFIKKHPVFTDPLVSELRNTHEEQAVLASWVISYLGEIIPQTMLPYLGELISVVKSTQSTSVKRNLLRAIQYIPNDSNHDGEIFDICISNILNYNEATAIRAFSIGICHNLIKVYPSLSQELKAVLESIEENTSSGLRYRINKVIKYIQQ